MKIHTCYEHGETWHIEYEEKPSFRRVYNIPLHKYLAIRTAMGIMRLVNRFIGRPYQAYLIKVENEQHDSIENQQRMKEWEEWKCKKSK